MVCKDREEFSDARRSERACQLLELPPVQWTGNPKAVHSGGWMGRLPIHPSQAPPGLRVNPLQPTEDAREGCPGSWYRSRFVATLVPYMRRRAEHGARVPNLLLDRCDDDVIIQLINYTEEQQEAYEAMVLQEIHRE